MDNSFNNILFKETLLSSKNDNSFLKTIPTTEINNNTKDINKSNDINKSKDIQEIYDKYNNLKNKIKLVWKQIE